jgi:phosphoglycolate phosphatase
MNEAKLLLFDLDGTLIDSRADLARAVNLVLRDLGRTPLDEATVAGFVGDGVPTLIRRSLTATHPEQMPPDRALHQRGIGLMHDHYADQMLVATRLYPGVEQTLGLLGDKGLAVVTSKEVRFTQLLLDHFGIADCFDCIVGGDTTPARKPDPGPVLEAIKLLKGSAGETVMIGDSENDVIAGRKAGTRTCAVTYGFRSAEQLRFTSPDFMIDRFDQLIELFC